MGFTCSKHLILCRNLLLNVPNFQHAAVDVPTRNLALEWGTDYDIRLNGIAPGPIGDTPGLSKLVPKEISQTREFLPLCKVEKKWDIAMAALYFASDAGC